LFETQKRVAEIPPPAGNAGVVGEHYESTIGLQSRSNPTIHTMPVDVIAAPCRNPTEYVLHF
jgi:hypothetical protein